jgi:hypothetical protein
MNDGGFSKLRLFSDYFVFYKEAMTSKQMAIVASLVSKKTQGVA